MWITNVKTSLTTMIAGFCLVTASWAASPQPWRFDLIDGGVLDLSSHAGPVLVVNTASLCAFTPQYDALQDLHETYGDRGLMVIAVPSDDFRQELDDADAVKEFCEINFDLTLPITAITPVRGADAHPFFADVKARYNVEPLWNFTKFLVDDGDLLDSWGSTVRPGSPEILRAIETALR